MTARDWGTLQTLVRKLIAIRGIRFLFVGGLNSLFGFTVFSLIAHFNAPSWQALLGGILAGIVFNFFTFGGVVFRDLSARRFPSFVLAYLVIFAINLECIEWITQATKLDRIAAQALLTVPMAMISYVLLSKLVFRGTQK